MLQGSIVALVTPFTATGEVDEAALKSLIDWHINQGTDAILVCGTTGESATLTHEEHRNVIRLAVTHVNKRVPVVAGCGSNATQESLGLVRYAHETGADYALVITPYYNKPTQEGLYRHFKAVSAETDIPVILYNVPGRTGVNMLPETVARLYRDCPMVIGVKEASGNIDQVVALMSLVDDKFILLSGEDGATVPMMAVGCKGVISVIANVMPRETHEMTAAFLAGDIVEAKRLQLYLYEMVRMMFVETNPIPAKTALGMMGRINSNLRLPLCEMNAGNREKLQALLKKYGLI
jgi:4-hydroxy-tetrahydrodipicolinate synthase